MSCQRPFVSTHLSAAVEGAAGDGRRLSRGVRRLGLRLEALLAVLVPEVVGAVAAGRHEGAEGVVEAHGVDRVDLGVQPVALEREVLLLQQERGRDEGGGVRGRGRSINGGSKRCGGVVRNAYQLYTGTSYTVSSLIRAARQ